MIPNCSLILFIFIWFGGHTGSDLMAGLEGQYVILGIKPCLAVCKENALPAILFLQPAIFFNGLHKQN